MNIDKTQYYITLVAIVFIAMMFFMTAWWNTDNSKIAGECKFTGIELTDVSPAECWSNDFSNLNCPIPKNMGCSFDVEGLGDIMKGMVKALK